LEDVQDGVVSKVWRSGFLLEHLGCPSEHNTYVTILYVELGEFVLDIPRDKSHQAQLVLEENLESRTTRQDCQVLWRGEKSP